MTTKTVTDGRVIFWFGTKGAERVRQPIKRGEHIPGLVPVTGTWSFRQPGHFLGLALQKQTPKSAWLKRLVSTLWGLGSSGKRRRLRQSLARLEMYDLYKNVEQVLLPLRLADSLPEEGRRQVVRDWATGFSLPLARMDDDVEVVEDAENAPPEGSRGHSLREVAELPGFNDDQFPQDDPQGGVQEPDNDEQEQPDLYMPLAGNMMRAFLVLPWGVPRGKVCQMGWLVCAPDVLAAACWELVFIVMHGIAVAYCSNCGGLYRGSKSVCPTCGSRRRTRTDRGKLLDLLAHWEKRGKITPEERARVKAILDNQGLQTAKDVLTALEKRPKHLNGL